MKNKVLWLISALSLVISSVSVKSLPDKIPMHYDMVGNVNRYGSKFEVFIFTGMILLLTVIWEFIIRNQHRISDKNADDKKSAEIQNNQKIMNISMIIMAFFFLGMQLTLLYTVFTAVSNNSADVMPDKSYSFISAIMGISFVLLGNIMPKAKKNHTFGVRTKWSMANDKTWSTSNRFAGYVFLISGIILTACALIFNGLILMYIFGIIIITATAVSVAYSYSAYKKYGKE